MKEAVKEGAKALYNQTRTARATLVAALEAIEGVTPASARAIAHNPWRMQAALVAYLATVDAIIIEINEKAEREYLINALCAIKDETTLDT